MTKDSVLILPLSIIKFTKERGKVAALALQLQSTSSRSAELLLPLLSAGQEHRIMPELEFAVNYSLLSWVLRAGTAEELAEKCAFGGS